MDNKEKYSHWEDIADYDLETAEAMLEAGRYVYVVFMCQQAVEKLVKGLHILYNGTEAPKTHNIARVFKMIFDNENNRKRIKNIDRFESVEDEYMEFFAELLYYYICERYPTYKQKLSLSISQKTAEDVLSKSKEAFAWLKSLNQ